MTSLLHLILAAALISTINNTNPPHTVVDTTNIPEWKASSFDYGGTLLLSDSPEIVPNDGILYQDFINGEGRVFFHHVNGTNVSKQFIILFENTGNNPAHIVVSRYGLGGPGDDYLAVGKAAQRAYMGGQNPYIIEIPPQKAAPLLSSDVIVQPNKLITGIYDFKTDQKVKVKILMVPVGFTADQYSKQFNVLPPDIYHLRGTFGTNNRIITPDSIYNPVSGPIALTLADNQVDKYIMGIDATDNSSVINYGNYGVVYHINIPTEGNSSIAYYLNPRGGTYSGAIEVKHQYSSSRLIDTPSGRVYFGDKTLGDAAPIGSYKSGTLLSFTFSPPGSSNLPVKLIAMPQK